MFTKTIALRSFALLLGSVLVSVAASGCAIDGTQQEPDPTGSSQDHLTRSTGPIMVPHVYRGYDVTCGQGYCKCTSSTDCSNLAGSGVCSDRIVMYGTDGYCHTDVFR